MALSLVIVSRIKNVRGFLFDTLLGLCDSICMETGIVTSKGQVVIPAKIRRSLGIGLGTRLIFEQKQGTIEVRPITSAYIDSIQGMLADGTGESWTSELLREHASEVEKAG